MKSAILDNNISKGDYDLANDIPIEMLESEETEYGNKWRTQRERNANLENDRGQAYSLILGQCTIFFKYNMKQDTAWNAISTSYNPLVLLQ